MSPYRVATDALAAAVPLGRPSLTARLWRKLQRVWLRRLVARRGTWRERHCPGCRVEHSGLTTMGYCWSCRWDRQDACRRALEPHAPDELPEIPDLVPLTPAERAFLARAEYIARSDTVVTLHELPPDARCAVVLGIAEYMAPEQQEQAV